MSVLKTNPFDNLSTYALDFLENSKIDNYDYQRFLEQSANKAENGIAKVSMQDGHCPVCYASVESIAHDQLMAGPEFVYELVEAGEIVAVITIAHDDVFAFCCFDSRNQCSPVALFRYADDSRAR